MGQKWQKANFYFGRFTAKIRAYIATIIYCRILRLNLDNNQCYKVCHHPLHLVKHFNAKIGAYNIYRRIINLIIRIDILLNDLINYAINRQKQRIT